MQAVTFSAFGGPEVIEIREHSVRQPGPGEVVVDVAAASINPTDIMMRSGAQAKTMTDLRPPYVAGMEFSGRVADTGQGVGLTVGQPVIGVVNPRRPAGGAQAQRVCVPAAWVAAIDEKIDLTAAASVAMNSLTAALALEMLDLSPGQTLLVTGGTGIMGGFAIQLAREAGLTVLANGADRDRSLLMELGAHEVLPRDAADLDPALHTACPAGVGGLIDGALIGAKLSHRVRDGGGAVALRASHPIEDARLRTFVVSVGKAISEAAQNERIARIIERIARHLERGILTPRLARGGRVRFQRCGSSVRDGRTRRPSRPRDVDFQVVCRRSPALAAWSDSVRQIS